MLNRVADGFAVTEALAEIEARPSLWELFTLRQSYLGSAHHDTECIALRGPAVPDLLSAFNDLEAYDYPVIYALPKTVKLVRDAVAKLRGYQIGRVMVVKLKAGGSIDAHTDEGPYADWYTSRFHLVLSSEQGNSFHNGGDTEWMRPGELWKFDHKVEHRATNLSADPRVHIIIDARKAED